MSIRLHCDEPQSLLDAIVESIDDGAVEQWIYDEDGDFTHSAKQWNQKAWLRPTLEDGNLIFGIITPSGESISSELYAIYHGRFLEMLLSHHDDLFSSAEVTSIFDEDYDLA